MANLVVEDMIPPKFKNTFVCEIETMMGDADAWHTVEVPFDEKDYGKLAKLLKEMDKIHWSNSLHKLKNAYKFFGKDDDRLLNWKYDYDADLYYAYYSHKIFYYGIDSSKYNVSVR